jgi:UDP-N-acetyl-D-glucosamine dehydrogenase
VAEASKLIENTYRAVNIALANEFKTIFDTLDIDFYEAMDAAATKPYGFAAFFPGPGVGGHCIPIDPFYLTWKTAQVEANRTPLIDHALEINERAYLRTIDALARELLARGKNMLDKPKVLLIGAAYKAGVEDVRESPFFSILNALLVVGVHVDYLDPMVPQLKWAGTTMTSVREIGLNYDAAIIVTTQPGVDYSNLQATMPIIIDSRRSYDKHYDNVVRA